MHSHAITPPPHNITNIINIINITTTMHPCTTITMQPCTYHAPPMHGPASPLSQTPIRPHLMCRHSDYMILKLYFDQLFLCCVLAVSLCIPTSSWLACHTLLYLITITPLANFDIRLSLRDLSNRRPFCSGSKQSAPFHKVFKYAGEEEGLIFFKLCDAVGI